MSLQALEARVVPVRLCGYFPHCLLVDCSSWMNLLHLWSSMYCMVPHQPKPIVWIQKICTTAQSIPLARCLQNLPIAIKPDLMDHLLHIYHQGLHTNPQLAINLLYGIFWGSVNAIQLAVSVLHICSAEDGYKWDWEDLCGSTCVGFLRLGLCASPRSSRARLLIGHLVATTLTIWQNIVHMPVCTSNVISHRRLLLSPSFTPSVHGNSRRPQISRSCCSCVCAKSNHWNLSEPNSVQMYRAASDNTLPWNLCADRTGKHTIARAHPRACGPLFLSPTKGSASVFHGARQTLFDNLFMGWNKKTTCAWWDDSDLMFAQGEREREGERGRGGGGNKRKVSRDWRSQKYWRIKSNFHLWSVYYTLSGRAIIIKYTNILTYCIFYVSAEKTNEKAAKDDDDWSRHTSGTVVCLSDVLSVTKSDQVSFKLGFLYRCSDRGEIYLILIRNVTVPKSEAIPHRSKENT